MPTDSQPFEDVISGHVIHVGEGKSVAIYQRNGVCWIADFQCGAGRLIDAASWFRFHTGVLRYSHSRRAAALESMAPISPEMAEQIRRLHRPATPAARTTPTSQPSTTAPSHPPGSRQEGNGGPKEGQIPAHRQPAWPTPAR